MKKKGIIAALALGMMIPALHPIEASQQKKATKEVKIESISFTHSKAPTTIAEMTKPFTTSSVIVKYTNGKTKSFPLTYKRLFKSTDKFKMSNGKTFSAGTPTDYFNKPITDKSATGKLVHYVSDAPDANSLLRPMKNGSLYLISHYEYDSLDRAGNPSWRRIPASMTISKLQQTKTGELKVSTVDKISFSSTNGLWVPCAGSLTPWNTHLGSEEYEPDARSFEFDTPDQLSQSTAHVMDFAKLYFGDEKKANPYYYGFIPEVIVSADGKTRVVKHYSTGRRSNEIMVVMPDERTAYFGDDGEYTMLFMYVADKPRDLSSGTLYAAKFIQTSEKNGGSGKLQWIKLGHATDKEIKQMIDSGIKFSDIFEVSDEPKEGFVAVKQYSAQNSNYGKIEYLKLKPGMEKAAAFLESRRYGAMLGATSEFNKMEGIAVNSKDKKVYVAIADISKGMEKNAQDPVDHIQLSKVKAGAVYELSLTSSQKSMTGESINSKYVATSMRAIIVGEDLKQPDAYGNKANVNKIAGPDNLSFSSDYRTLFIGEDSGQHINNFVWAYNVDTKKLSRILSVPAGAEATGLQAVDSRNGFSYIMSNFQHPGDELDNFKPTAVNIEDVKKRINATYGINQAGVVGYIYGLPNIQKLQKELKKQQSKK
ncbi:putative phosphatase [Anoxybacillus thermarum]|uniref:Putative phosphatase n=1 Tax=Anoxybacillus thermarum TaxID=404937 RepID=A0A0D0RUT1_9BACL|nr:alkaline phosphatase PhoX [Anoxybacillus thermarum]KIQ95357.1 putative phosphatase [Anoxybacillus thermarum]